MAYSDSRILPPGPCERACIDILSMNHLFNQEPFNDLYEPDEMLPHVYTSDASQLAQYDITKPDCVVNIHFT